MSVKIIPSTLVQSKNEFLSQIKGLGESLDMIQLDIADGGFVDNKTWADPKVVRNISLDVELHLMVDDPYEELKKWEAVSQIKRVLIHYESEGESTKELIHKLKDNNIWQIGVVLNPETDISVLESFLGSIDVVMFMGVHPGLQGQSFLPETLEKIRQFKNMNTSHMISIDGGVNKETINDIVMAGADIVCPGSAIFHTDKTPSENVEEMKYIIDNINK